MSYSFIYFIYWPANNKKDLSSHTKALCVSEHVARSQLLYNCYIYIYTIIHSNIKSLYLIIIGLQTD